MHAESCRHPRWCERRKKDTAKQEDAEKLRLSCYFGGGQMSHNRTHDFLLNSCERTFGKHVSQVFICAHMSDGHRLVKIDSLKQIIQVNTVDARRCLELRVHPTMTMRTDASLSCLGCWIEYGQSNQMLCVSEDFSQHTPPEVHFESCESPTEDASGSQLLNKRRALRTPKLRVASRNKMIAFETSFLTKKMPHLVVPVCLFCTC